MTSASSKAALGLAHLLTRRGVRVTGLTSAGRVAFTAGLKAYDRVLGYDQVATLPAAHATVVDIAGDAALRDQIARRLKLPGEVVVAGGTHGEASALATGAFSAPRYIRDLAHEWGWPELERRYRAALGEFAAAAGAWLEIVRHRGLDAAARVYREVLAGSGRPAAAHVIDPALRPR